MDYNISSKPTIYNDILFRSRLEARWAAFFDLLGFKYDYEPVDLVGWSPDFLLRGKNSNIFIEVKPFITDEIKAEYLIKINKGVKVREGYPACILLDNFTSTDFDTAVLAGYLAWDNHNYVSCHWKLNQKGNHSVWDIGSEEMYFDGLLWEDWENRKEFATKERGLPILLSHWRTAGNRVKFDII